MKTKSILFLLFILTIGLLLQGCSSNNSASVQKTSSSNSAKTSSVTLDSTKHKSLSWELIFETKAEHPNFCAGFINENEGITVGAEGEIHYTADGGKTWPQSKNVSACRYGLDILNEKLAWSCGNCGNIRVSKDAGKTWSEVTDVKSQSTFISFIDDKTGWVADKDWLQVTSDSGKTWKDVIIPGELKDIAAINLISSSAGFILDRTGLLYSTKDSGKTWETVDLGLKNLNIEDNKILSLASGCAAIRFDDSNNGVIAFSAQLKNKGGEVWVFKTADGGKTWTNESLGLSKNKDYILSTVYLSHDAKLLTVRSDFNKISLYKQK